MTQDAPSNEPLPPGGCAADVALVAQRFRPRLVRYFRRHLDSLEDAEDLAQETLVRVIRSPASASVANLEAYLLAIAGNLLRDRIRRDRASHSRQHVPIDEVIEEWPAEVICGERVYLDKERLQGFLEALGELPPRCRQVFLLQRYEGLTYSAVAMRLGISVSAVEKQMMRALLHFASRMESP